MLNPVSDAAAEPPEAQVIRLDTLPDAMRKLRRMAEEIHATHFATFIIVQRGERRQLVPCLDAHYPGISERSKMMTALLGDRFAKRISGTARPLWWSKSEDQAVFADAHFAERIEVPAGSQSGLALPVAAEHGPEGTIVLTGERLVLNAAALCDIHARCFALFGVIARLGPPAGNSTPAISKRELECLMLTANGLTSDEIADKLGLSVHTANQYLTNTSRKLNAVNRVHAVAKALRLGMFD
ncbi:helix-turn-helix transcriptional regulator [Mesorhizobium sp. Z1-4]|uniref:helix-turn-helix transcriptional regulator n=1 Tax=Mesorhizobium sp. Z1-4 TaxID=2448478 RepID=UPI000FD71F3C|nr:helix-turn-helix transcriptional regulator [Mesorhizobium sp. Z1-4]